MLRVATLNVNGVRASHRRGFGDWLATRGCDVVALQEVRAPLAALPPGAFGDHHAVYEPGEIPGRNGVAVLTRERPAGVRTWDAEVLVRAPGDEHLHTEPAPDEVPLARGLAAHAHEGRYVEVDLAEAPVTVASLYLPKGGLPAHLQDPRRMREAPDGGARHARKMRFMAAFARHLRRTRRAAAARGRQFLLLGDLNVAHTRLDVASWRRAQRAEGFLPEERAWLDEQLTPRTLVDVVRSLHPGTEGPYLVELARRGLRARRRLADRLPPRHPGPGPDRRARRRRPRPPGRPSVRPRAGGRRLRRVTQVAARPRGQPLRSGPGGMT